MGAWGVALYSDDYTRDVRGDYRDALWFGKTDEEAIQEVIRKNAPKPGSEDESVFWYALADTMWNYGRLTPEIKEKALYYLENVQEDDRWDSEKTWERRKLVLAKLKEKLLSEQPPRKRVSRYVPYVCPWKLGDVFAYQMHKKASEEYGALGKYILFRKVTERYAWPHNTIPVIQIYKWIGDQIPSIEEIKELPVLKMDSGVCGYPIWAKYFFGLDINSNRELKAQNFRYVGNIQDDQLVTLTEEQKWARFEVRGANNFDLCFLSWFTEVKNGELVVKERD